MILPFAPASPSRASACPLLSLISIEPPILIIEI
jgi:hypothetical protein